MLDVIGFGQKPHFWNQETSCSNTPYLVFQEEQGLYLRRVKMTREEGMEVGCHRPINNKKSGGGRREDSFLASESERVEWSGVGGVPII